MLDMASFTAPPVQLPPVTTTVQPLDTARARTDNNDSSPRSNNSMTSPVPLSGRLLQQQKQQYHNDLHYHQNNQYHPNNPAAGPHPEDEFHLTIPAYLMKHGKSLAEMDQTALAECMKPVMQSLRGLNAESLLGLERVENGARLCDGVNVRPIHDEVFPKYDFAGLSCVRYVHIAEIPEQYSIGIFVFPPFARIPLHDHPEMCVLSRLLYGDLQCLSLDLPGASQGGSNSASGGRGGGMFGGPGAVHHDHPNYIHEQPPQGLPEGSCRAYKNPIKHLHAPDVSVLFPYKGNLHEFFAGPNGAAVLDILLPPYDVEHERDCTFYDIREDPLAAAAAAQAHAAAIAAAPVVNPQQGGAMVMDMDDSHDGIDDVLDDMMNEALGPQRGGTGPQQDAGATTPTPRTPCWIIPTVQPHDFHCLSGQYHKLGANVLSMQNTK